MLVKPDFKAKVLVLTAHTCVIILMQAAKTRRWGKSSLSNNDSKTYRNLIIKQRGMEKITVDCMAMKESLKPPSPLWLAKIPEVVLNEGELWPPKSSHQNEINRHQLVKGCCRSLQSSDFMSTGVKHVSLWVNSLSSLTGCLKKPAENRANWDVLLVRLIQGDGQASLWGPARFGPSDVISKCTNRAKISILS